MLLGCSDNYELIDSVTRFNKQSGELEILQESGEWIEKKSIKIKEKTNSVSTDSNDKFSENNMTYFLL
tara:strand:- start:194 stop:397 length:204 start_codon:yes stop_codon:yes gene_type:complete